MPIPTRLNEPSRTNTIVVVALALSSSICGKNSTSATKVTAVWTSPYAMAYRTDPSSCDPRRTGAMKVYSSVPSHRSTAIVSAIQLKTTDR